MVDGGVDFIIAETFTWLGEALLAAERIRAAGLPAMVTMSYENAPKSYEGHGPGECAKRLVDAGTDIVGINCLRNPASTLPLMREVRAAVPGFIAAQPVAYRTPAHQHDFTALPEFPLGLDPLQLNREEMGRFAAEARDMGIQFIGSCCGSVACHVKAMAVALGKKPASEREWRSTTGKAMSAKEYYEEKHAD
jgi:betaine-homocysteine S-methyltransferase